MSGQERRLHLGCGLTTPAGWLNVDGSWNARLAKRPLLRKTLTTIGLAPREQGEIAWAKDVFIHNVKKPLPWGDGTWDVIYTSHLLEHLYYDEAQQLLRECRRVLRPGGILRVVVPDLGAIIEDYLKRREHRWGLKRENGASVPPGDDLNQRMMTRPQSQPGGNPLLRYYRLTSDFHTHKWMYDAESLIAKMEESGFTDVARRGYLESRIAGLELVEKEDRVVDGGLAVEGVRK